MVDRLHIGEGLDLPLEAITETFVILAKRGSGKTYTGAVMAEAMIGAGLPVIVLDPIGVWWGLRSSADGKSDGLPVVIFGGDHGDVPLEATAGSLLADVIVDQRIPAVFDLSGLSKTQSRRFATDFLERLYHRNRDPLHVIVDEADAFAPQRTSADGARLLGAMEDLVRRGRARGLGVTLITQRPAVLNKDVLTQAEVLVALRMTGPRDVAAIDEWIRLHADEDEARALKQSLPALPIGTAWWWSPGWLGILTKAQTRRRTTFDSSATPKQGQRRPEPRRLAPVDLERLGEQIAATVERAKAEDPKALRSRVVQLERDLAAERDKPPTIERVEVPMLAEDLVLRLEGVLGDLRKHGQQAVDVAQDMLDQLARFTAPTLPAPRQAPAAPVRTERAASTAPRPVQARREPSGGDGAGLGKAHRAVLTVLAQHGPRTKTQVALLTGYSHNGGGFNNALSALRSAGYIEGRDTLNITDPGVDALGPFEPLPSGRALIDHWQSRLGKAERLILDVLVSVWPETRTKEELADATGYAANGGGFNNAISRLRSLELIEGRGEMCAAQTLGEQQ